MKLDSQHPRMGRDLRYLTQLSLVQFARKYHALLFKGRLILVVELIAVTVSFPNEFLPIGLVGEGSFFDVARVGAEAHGSAEVLDLALLAEHRDDGIGGVAVHFSGVGLGKAKDMTGKLDD